MNSLVRLIAGTAMVLLACGLAVAEPLALAIAKAAVVSDQASGRRALNLKMTPESAKAFADFTRANVGKVVDLSVDGRRHLRCRRTAAPRGTDFGGRCESHGRGQG